MATPSKLDEFVDKTKRFFKSIYASVVHTPEFVPTQPQKHIIQPIIQTRTSISSYALTDDTIKQHIRTMSSPKSGSDNVSSARMTQIELRRKVESGRETLLRKQNEAAYLIDEIQRNLIFLHQNRTHHTAVVNGSGGGAAEKTTAKIELARIEREIIQLMDKKKMYQNQLDAASNQLRGIDAELTRLSETEMVLAAASTQKAAVQLRVAMAESSATDNNDIKKAISVGAELDKIDEERKFYVNLATQHTLTGSIERNVQAEHDAALLREFELQFQDSSDQSVPPNPSQPDQISTNVVQNAMPMSVPVAQIQQKQQHQNMLIEN